MHCTQIPSIHPGRQAVVEHSMKLEHWIRFKDMVVLAEMAGFMDCLVKEAIEMCLHPSNMNGDVVDMLSVIHGS